MRMVGDRKEELSSVSKPQKKLDLSFIHSFSSFVPNPHPVSGIGLNIGILSEQQIGTVESHS